MHMPALSAAFSDVALVAARRPKMPFSPSSSVRYHSRWSADSGMRTMVSVLGGRSLDSTDFLVRRSMRGCSSERAAATAESSPNAAAPSVSIFSAPAASSTSWNSTDTSARSSCRLFCSGVPVSSRADAQRMRRTACDARLESFLTRCASSSTRYRKWKRAASMACSAVSISYVVTSTSKVPDTSTSVFRRLRSASGPWNATARRLGHQRLASVTHVGSTDSGHTTRWGPASPLASRRYCRNESTWSVLPRPMSSPRMPPPAPAVCCAASHATPSRW
mmetsp:Transcript_25169/g.62138  ORF Transcript_25169/g.62138 Transcript_25169/m.62138 type:complete len:277 (-) Transcript_25169:780-1610(-)